MMRIIVNNGETVYFSLAFKTAVCSGEIIQTFGFSLQIGTDQVGCREGCDGIGHIMDTGNPKCKSAGIFAAADQSKRSAAIRIKADIGGMIIAAVQTVGDNRTYSVTDDFLIFFDRSIDNQSAVGREMLGENMERMSDVIEIFEEIKMVGIDIQNNCDLRVQTKEAV